MDSQNGQSEWTVIVNEYFFNFRRIYCVSSHSIRIFKNNNYHNYLYNYKN